jgi:hypothetical protein
MKNTMKERDLFKNLEKNFNNRLEFNKQLRHANEFLRFGLGKQERTPPYPIKPLAHCKELIENKIKTKKRFHEIRQHIHESYQAYLNAPLLSNKQEWVELKNHIENCEKEVLALAKDISDHELEIKGKLWSADLALSAVITEEQKKAVISITAIDALKDLKDEIGNLKYQINNEAKFSYSCPEYPSYRKNIGLKWSENNMKDLDSIQETLKAEKSADTLKNKKIENQHRKIVDSASKVMVEQYSQSVKTGILNVIGIITGIGIAAGIYNKISGSNRGNFFMWDIKPLVNLYKKEGDALRQPADILGIPKNG